MILHIPYLFTFTVFYIKLEGVTKGFWPFLGGHVDITARLLPTINMINEHSLRIVAVRRR